MDPVQPNAILLDLDDTVIDYSGGLVTAWRAVCDATASEVPGLQSAALLDAICRVREWYWSDPERHREGRANLRAASGRIVAQALGSLGYDLPRLAQTVANTYRDLRDDAIHPFPGAIDTLERMRGCGIRLGLVTNGSGPDQRAKIDRFDLARHFDHILVEGEFGCGKPDERVYRAALDALRSRAEATWFVGDNLEWDVAAPQRLGLYGVWVDGAGAGLPAGAAVEPHRTIRALTELF